MKRVNENCSAMQRAAIFHNMLQWRRWLHHRVTGCNGAAGCGSLIVF
jgi:hypothetical protein